MAGAAEGDGVASLRQDRSEAVELIGEAGAGGEGVELGENRGAAEKTVGVEADGAGHAHEDAMDFGLFFVEEAKEFVVGFDGLQGLDEDSLASGGRAMDDAGDAAAELGFDGDGEAVAADGDEFVLNCSRFRDGSQGAAKGVLDGAVLALEGAADAGELGAGVV